MGFVREHLPDPITFYEGQGLTLKGRGKWRTTSCVFHGGSDSMRINVQSGGFICMSCGAHGGDVAAYYMAAHGVGFVEAAKALGAWQDDGRPAPARPTPIPARDALQLLAREANLIAVAAANVAHGVALTAQDLARLLHAAGRITKIAGYFA